MERKSCLPSRMAWVWGPHYRLLTQTQNPHPTTRGTGPHIHGVFLAAAQVPGMPLLLPKAAWFLTRAHQIPGKGGISAGPCLTSPPLDLASLLPSCFWTPACPPSSLHWCPGPSWGLGVLPCNPGSHLQQTCQVWAKPAPSAHVRGPGKCIVQSLVQPWGGTFTSPQAINHSSFFVFQTFLPTLSGSTTFLSPCVSLHASFSSPALSTCLSPSHPYTMPHPPSPCVTF